jgi:hypothetical protein
MRRRRIEQVDGSAQCHRTGGADTDENPLQAAQLDHNLDCRRTS